MKILAIDPGTKRVGLAACDEMGLTTRLLPVLDLKKNSRWIQDLVELVVAEGFAKVLLGLPLNMDGSEGEPSKRSRRLANSLQKKLTEQGWEGSVDLWDERLTSFEAEDRLRQRGVPKGKAKEFLDSLAAQIILEDFLRSQK